MLSYSLIIERKIWRFSNGGKLQSICIDAFDDIDAGRLHSVYIRERKRA
jgi:hypothetical protein